MMKRAFRSSGLAFAVFLAMWSQAFALDIVRAVLNGDADRVRQYLASGADPNTMHLTGRSVLAVAVSRGHADVVEVLIEGGADIELGWPAINATPLSTAARTGQDEIVRLLIAAGANVNHSDYGITPLGTAIHHGHETVVRQLVEAGATITASDIRQATDGGHTGIVEILKGKEPDLAAQVDVDAIWSAVLTKNAAELRDALAKGGDPNMENVSGTLLRAAVSGGDVEVAKVLLEAGADVDRGWTALGRTPLMSAVLKGNEEMVRFLIAAGANVDHADVTNATALLHAIILGHENIVGLLLSEGAKADRSALALAQQHGHAKIEAMLREAGAGSR